MSAADAADAPLSLEGLIARLGDAIGSGDLPPGRRLVEAELTARYGVGRGLLREALRVLGSEGVVESAPHRGARVRRLSRDDVRDLYELREAVEGLAARLCAERIDVGDHRDRWERALVRARVQEPELPAYAEETEALHLQLVQLSGNAALVRMWRQVRPLVFRPQLQPYLDDRHTRHAVDDHVLVIRAVLAGDGAGAEGAMRAHVRLTARSVLALPAQAFAGP